LTYYPSRIPDLDVKKSQDPGSATLAENNTGFLVIRVRFGSDMAKKFWIRIHNNEFNSQFSPKTFIDFSHIHNPYLKVIGEPGDPVGEHPD
jgi:hypothetical protein